MSRKHQPISREEQALAGYIAAMFGSAPPVPVAAPIRKAEPVPPVLQETEAAKLANVRKLLADTVAPAVSEPAPAVAEVAMPVVKVDPPAPPPAPVPVVAPPPAPPVAEPVSSPLEQVALVLPPERSVNLIPEWGEKRFQTLFFRVGPLTLAVPLSQLGGIFALEKERITPLFGKPKWFMGLHPFQGGNMQIVDTARWVMPEKYAEVTAEGLQLDYVIRLGETPWALACSQVHDAVTLEHDDIRWRSSLGRRPWLAGVVVDKMCALLDVENFIFLLENNQFETRHQGGGLAS